MKLFILILSLIFSFTGRTTVDHWETVVYEDDSWKYIVPTSAVSLAWNTLAFNDASWLNGTAGYFLNKYLNPSTVVDGNEYDLGLLPAGE